MNLIIAIMLTICLTLAGISAIVVMVVAIKEYYK